MTSEGMEMDRGLAELLTPLLQGMRVFRGVNFCGDEFTFPEVGDYVHLESWTSTSTSPSVSVGFGQDHLWDVWLPAGTRAIVTNPREREVILPPSIFFLVLRVERGEIDERPSNRILAEAVQTE